MTTTQVTPPKGASPELRQMAKEVNALARKMASRSGTIATAGVRVGAIQAENKSWLGPNKRDRRQMVSEARKARTAGIDLADLQRQHMMAKIVYEMALEQWENDNAPDEVKLVRRYLASDLELFEGGTITGDTFEQYGWDESAIDIFEAAKAKGGVGAVFVKLGEPPIVVSTSEMPTFTAALNAEVARRALAT